MSDEQITSDTQPGTYISASRLRQLWKDFWEHKAPAERQHAWVPPAGLVVNSAEDATTMFNAAGMQPLVPYLMGKAHPQGTRLYNIQGCIRTVDLDEVGDATHLTFFEMMGNWSLGDYFKAESIRWSWEFLTGDAWLGLDPRRLAVTVFAGDEHAPRDEESAALWREVSGGALETRISFLGADDNWWSPGPVGPCGPDTEIFYWVGAGDFPPAGSTVADDPDNWMEIWNNVFMAYHRNEHGELTALEHKNVDTGMGFERIASVVQQVETLYETDIFSGILSLLSSLTQKAYDQHKTSCRIVADHLRTTFCLLSEGLTPSNEGRGYVLRRIMRRMYFHFSLLADGVLDLHAPGVLSASFVPFLQEYGRVYPHFLDQQDDIMRALIAELQQFQQTIVHGQQKLTEFLERHGLVLSGKHAFMLYDTYGLPAELTQEIVASRGGRVDMDGFAAHKAEAQQRSRQGTQQMFAKGTDWSLYIEGVPPTLFVGYTSLDCNDAVLLKDVTVDGMRVLMFDKTPFYAESGGQKGDSGLIRLPSGEDVRIAHVIQYAGVFLHIVE